MKDISKFPNKYTAVVKSIDYDTWNITFEVPGVIGNMEKLPTATCSFSPSRQIKVGDTVTVTQASPMQNDNFSWVPDTSGKGVFLQMGSNKVDVTEEGIITINNGSSVIELNGDTVSVKCSTYNVNSENINLKGNTKLEGTLEVSGKTSIKSDVEISGNLKVSGQIDAGQAILGGINFSSHTHGGVESGPGTTTPPM